MNKLLITTFAMLLFALSSTATAQDIRLDVKAGAQVTTHTSFDALSDTNTLGSRTIRASAGLVPGLRLVVDYGNDSNPEILRHGTAIRLTWVRHRFTAGAEYGPELWGFLRPFAGATFGYALGKLRLDTFDALYRDYSHDMIGEGYLGAETFLRLGGSDSPWVGTAGFRFGARGQTGATFDELAGQDREEDDPWTRVNPQLGTLHPNGWYWDIGIGVSLAF